MYINFMFHNHYCHDKSNEYGIWYYANYIISNP